MYVDTSVIAKLYFPEHGSELAQRVASSEGELVCSELLIAEFASVASRNDARRPSLSANKTRC